MQILQKWKYCSSYRISYKMKLLQKKPGDSSYCLQYFQADAKVSKIKFPVKCDPYICIFHLMNGEY